MQEKAKSLGPKSILVTGGTGFLGSHLARELVNEGHKVTLIKRPNSGLSRIEDIKSQIQMYNADDFAGGEFDCFFNAATSYGRKGESDKEIEISNCQFPLSILSKLNLPKLHLINLGTSLPDDLNVYTRSKKNFVNECLNLKELHLFSNVTLENFYGPHDSGIVSFIIKKIKDEEKAIELTEGKQKRDLIYYKDALRALILIMNEGISGNIPVGSGLAPTLKEVIMKISEKMNNSTTELKFGAKEYRPDEPMYQVADISILESNGWSPQFDLDKGLEDCLRGW